MPGAGELCREGGPYRIVCGGEGGAEDIADGLEDAALVVLNTRAQEVFVAGQGRARGFGNGMVLFKPPLPSPPRPAQWLPALGPGGQERDEDEAHQREG